MLLPLLYCRTLDLGRGRRRRVYTRAGSVDERARTLRRRRRPLLSIPRPGSRRRQPVVLITANSHDIANRNKPKLSSRRGLIKIKIPAQRLSGRERARRAKT